MPKKQTWVCDFYDDDPGVLPSIESLLQYKQGPENKHVTLPSAHGAGTWALKQPVYKRALRAGGVLG